MRSTGPCDAGCGGCCTSATHRARATARGTPPRPGGSRGFRRPASGPPCAGGRQVRQRVVLRQSDAGRDAGRSEATSAVDLGRLEGLKAGTEVQVAVKQRMVSDLPEVAVGDLTLPVLRRTLADALVEHTQGSLELVRENGLEVVDHGTHSCVTLPPAAERQGYAAGTAWKKVRPHPLSLCALRLPST